MKWGMGVPIDGAENIKSSSSEESSLPRALHQKTGPADFPQPAATKTRELGYIG